MHFALQGVPVRTRGGVHVHRFLQLTAHFWFCEPKLVCANRERTAMSGIFLSAGYNTMSAVRSWSGPLWFQAQEHCPQLTTQVGLPLTSWHIMPAAHSQVRDPVVQSWLLSSSGTLLLQVGRCRHFTPRTRGEWCVRVCSGRTAGYLHASPVNHSPLYPVTHAVIVCVRIASVALLSSSRRCGC